MWRKLLCIPLLSSLSTVPVLAQKKISPDSLKVVLANHLYQQNYKEVQHLAAVYLPGFDKYTKKHDTSGYHCLYLIATTYTLMGRYDKLEETLVQFEAFTRKRFGPADIHYYFVLDAYFWLYTFLPDYSKAIMTLAKKHEVLKNIFEKKGMAVSAIGRFNKTNLQSMLMSEILNSATNYAMIGNVQKADQFLTEAGSGYRDFENEYPIDFYRSLVALGKCYIATDQLEKAENTLKESIAWARKRFGSFHPNLARSLSNYAVFLHNLGNPAAAEKLYLEARTIEETVMDTESDIYSVVLRSLGALATEKKDFRKAEQFYTSACNMYSKDPGHQLEDYTNSSVSLAAFYQRMQQPARADSIYRKLEIVLQGKTFGTVGAYRNFLTARAGYYTENKNYAAADSLYNLYFNYLVNASDRQSSNYAHLLLRKAVNHYYWGHQANAEQLITEAISVIRLILAKNFTFLSEEQKQQYLGRFNQYYHVLFSILLRSQNPELKKLGFDLLLMLKGLLLQSSVFSARHTDLQTPEYSALFNRYIALKKSILTFYERGEGRSAKAHTLEAEADAAEKELTRLSAGFVRQKFNPVTHEQVRAALKEQETIIEFVRFTPIGKADSNAAYGAIILRKQDTVPSFQYLFSENELRPQLEKATSSAFITALYNSNRLYDLIWKPLEKTIAGSRRIFIVPDGLLHLVAFSAIRNPAGKFLSDQQAISILTSSRHIVPQSRMGAEKTERASIVLFGGIHYDTDSNTLVSINREFKGVRGLSPELTSSTTAGNPEWQYMPGTKTETDSIAALFPDGQKKLIQGDRATEEAFKNLSGQSPSVIHIATHGFSFHDMGKMNWNPGKETFNNEQTLMIKPLLQSGLVMAGANRLLQGKKRIEGTEDGFLTAYEISLLDLSRSGLAVLSACKTGLGTVSGNEGVFGLQRAFKMAGVKSLIISLWEVPDQQTAELMYLFYSQWNLLKDQNLAMLEAQKRMREKYDNPYYWAGFELID